MKNNELNKHEQILKDYDNEPIIIPNIEKEWKTFEPIYFTKKKKRIAAYWMYSGLVIIILYSLQKILITQKDTAHTESQINLQRTGPQKNSKNDTKPERQELHASTLSPLTGSKGGKSLLTVQKRKKQQLRNQNHDPKPLIKSTDSEIIFSLDKETDKSLPNLTLNYFHSDPKNYPYLSNIGRYDTFKVYQIETSDIDTMTKDTLKTFNKKNKRKSKRTYYAVHFDNQFSSSYKSKAFNPEIGMQIQYKLKKTYLQSGLGIGYNQFSTYNFSYVENHFDSLKSINIQDSSLGKHLSSTYFFVPLNIGIPINKYFQLRIGTTLTLPISNKFEKTTYYKNEIFIGPSGIDSIPPSTKVTENYYTFNPSIRLSCDLIYKMQNLSIVLGVRRPIYNGLKTLKLPGSTLERPAFNFAFGLSYHF